MDFKGLNARLLGHAATLLHEWLPGGKLVGHEYQCGDLTGGAGASLKINIQNGMWKEWAGGPGGSDLVALYAAVKGVTQKEAFIALGGQANGKHPSAFVPEERAETELAAAVPAILIEPKAFRHAQHGDPAALWIYKSAEGTPLAVVARYETPTGKTYCPWSNGKQRWEPKAPPKPRPLYGLDRLAVMDGPVLVTEGEKACDAAQRYFPTRPCVTWMGGAASVAHADWTPLEGREVTLWPDADDAGRAAMANLAERLLKLGCEVRVIQTATLAQGHDIADFEAAGASKDHVIGFARMNAMAVKPPTELKAPREPQGPVRVQEYPRAGHQTLENAPVGGSLVELWARYGFACKPNGRPYNNEWNVMCALEAEQAEVWYDSFSQRIMGGVEPWDDEHTLNLTIRIQTRYGIPDMGRGCVEGGVHAYAFNHQHNPLREWLSALRWDNTRRLHELLARGMGAVDNDYSAQVGRCFVVGMVARAMQPGCKLDNMPVFEGAEGILKSTALKILGGEYFAEIHESISSKDFFVAIRGKWICEIAELHAFRVADIERIKGIISTATDRYRNPYGRHAADHPRTCVFVGTTNRDDWNNDETGARRFWPVRCRQIDRAWLTQHREQLFAEAVSEYTRGHDWWLIPEEEAALQRSYRREEDPWEALMLEYLKHNDSVRVEYVIDTLLNLKAHQTDIGTQKRVARILRWNGYEKRVRDGRRVWVRRG